jgi:hypothetical protein
MLAARVATKRSARAIRESKSRKNDFGQHQEDRCIIVENRTTDPGYQTDNDLK